MTDPYTTEPATPRHYRIANLKGFLPLNEEPHNILTRGAALPSLIQSRSSTSIVDLRKTAGRRRRSSFGEDLSRSHTVEGRDHGRDRADSQLFSIGQHHGSIDGDFGPLLTPGLDQRRLSILMTPQMRSQRLIGNSNPRYKWQKYYKSEEELKKMKKPVRNTTSDAIISFSTISTISEESPEHTPIIQSYGSAGGSPRIDGMEGSNGQPQKVNRTKDLYKLKPEDENTPLLQRNGEVLNQDERGSEADYDIEAMPPGFEPEEDVDSSSRIVTIAIYVNLVANAALLIMKIIVVALSSSVSVLASLVDAALDFLSTAIVWTTTYLIARNDQYSYPIGRRRLEPVGVLVFSVIMITSFVQVALEGFQKITGNDETIVSLGAAAIAIMAATVVIKGLCWIWCRLINNSSVQALAQDAMTDVVFNIFSIIFPLVGFYARIWWLDPLGGILLSFWVIFNWSRTTGTHIKNLTGAAATADERNILLYLTMRFAKTIKQIQGLQAYHSGDKLNVEVDIVLDEHTSLRDSHDLGESLQYVLESVPSVDRAFVHLDYAGYNLPTHMRQ
ncbi:hypothetical protein MRB53_038819 [Persea americana]|nr:hypothetical protein MRB53_038819 [Persea americana]